MTSKEYRMWQKHLEQLPASMQGVRNHVLDAVRDVVDLIYTHPQWVQKCHGIENSMVKVCMQHVRKTTEDACNTKLEMACTAWEDRLRKQMRFTVDYKLKLRELQERYARMASTNATHSYRSWYKKGYEHAKSGMSPVIELKTIKAWLRGDRDAR